MQRVDELFPEVIELTGGEGEIGEAEELDAIRLTRPAPYATSPAMESDETRDLGARMAEHPVFSRVSDLEALRIFMQTHVFAVWDFMSLVKRLQRDLTGMSLPWMPPAEPKLARLINEIVLSEESDELPGGGFASHFEMYLEAMREVGADTHPIQSFLEAIGGDGSIEDALREQPKHVRGFVRHTLSVAVTGTTEEVAAAFFLGREDIIPGMFTRLMEQGVVGDAPMFRFYLKRHIELDGDEHGPAARACLERLTQTREARLRADAAGSAALRQRGLLWDGVVAQLERDDALEPEMATSPGFLLA